MPAVALTAAEVAQASGGRIVRGDPMRRFTLFGIDSRTVAPGQLFFAIRGPRHDGHAFLNEARTRGAAGVVVETGHAVSNERGAHSDVVIGVPDTTVALQYTAREVRRRSGARVVAITGSAGKTTTKEVAAAFLALRYRTFRNRGNLNNHIGLPLSLLELVTGPEMAVVELGMSAPGEIRTLVGIAEPEVRVWTNVAEAHLAHFASLDAIADAKAEILSDASSATVLVANAADPRVMSRASQFAGRVLTFGAVPEADIAATRIEDRGIDGISAEVSTPAGDAAVTTPLVGRGNLDNVLAGMAVALDAGVPLGAIVERARTLTPATHRGEVRRLASGVTLVDDVYNANPLAVTRALEVLASTGGSRRRVAVLGEMLELGESSMALHARCGRFAAQAGIELLVAVGGAPARALADAAIDEGLARASVHHVETSDEAASLVAQLARPGDLVLIKGSRGVHLEAVVEELEEQT